MPSPTHLITTYPRHQQPVLLDCRLTQAFCQGHLRDAGHIPADRLFEQMHQLPESDVPIRLCGDPNTLLQATQWLSHKGYKVIEQIIWQDELTEVRDDCSARMIWQPSPLVQGLVRDYAHLVPQRGRGLDLACGSGRDAVYLAMQGWQMTGVDLREEALRRASGLAASQGVVIDTYCLNLESTQQPFAHWEMAHFDLINVARYLHRPLFAQIKSLLAVDGIILYHTFMQGSEVFGSPKNPNFLLKQGELAEVFADWHIWCDQTLVLADGRPMSYFIAQKPQPQNE